MRLVKIVEGRLTANGYNLIQNYHHSKPLHPKQKYQDQRHLKYNTNEQKRPLLSAAATYGLAEIQKYLEENTYLMKEWKKSDEGGGESILL